MEILTWAEYKARAIDKGGFVLTHYSKLFNAAHCRVNIKGLNFQLGFDDRYFEKEWNNQVNQFKDSHLADFVEITAEVVREIKATLVNYEYKLIEVNAMLATGLSGTDYNGAKASQQHLEMMVNKYKLIVELLPSFEDVLLVDGSINSNPNKTNPYQGNTNMTNLEFIKSDVASEIMQLPKISFDYRSDVENDLLESIESNGYCQPSDIGTTAEAWDLVWSEMARNLNYEKPDFSSCDSALECVELEGQSILDAAYYETTQEIVSNIAQTIDELFSEDFNGKTLTEVFIGKSGLGHIPHDYETDIADSSVCVWNASNMIEINVIGVYLYGTLEQVED